MEPLAALGVCGNILQIVDFSCKLLSKGNQLRTSFSGTLPENVQLEKVITHLHGMVTKLQQHPATQSQGLDGMVTLCIQTASELIVVLERLKIQGANTRWKSFRAAVKSVWKKEKIDEILSRLELIRDEIEFGVIVGLRDQLIGLAAQQAIRFDQLDKSTRGVLQAVLNGQSASTAASHSQLRAIEDMNARVEAIIINEHQQTRNEIIDEIRQTNFQNMSRGGPMIMPNLDPNQQEEEKTDILVMLKFITIDDRHGAIPEAHRKTFEWVWDTQTPDRKWSNFWEWLTGGQGICYLDWISGKAGSGKSTLMKYIYHDERTKDGLQYWSDQSEVLTAGFFFWNSGSAMQRSLVGLLQSILYEILQQKPDLKEAVFPVAVQDEVSKRWLSRPPDTATIWTIADLKAAFNRLLQTPLLNICLFIDGLDEYEGDHSEIAELFKHIITSPSVKACLSSRPLVAFESAFSQCPSLRLQYLTYEDISLYVREKLEDREEVMRMRLSEPSQFQELVEEIIEKASGVFLWVTLAVRSLLDGITNYDRMADLRFRLRELPDDLSQLYWHMLQGIKPAFYLEQAAKLLKIMHTAYSENQFLTPEHLSYAEEYVPGAPIPIPDPTYQPYAPAYAKPMAEKVVEGRLKSRCRGLLEVRNGTVAFLHQSVADFLVQPEVKTSLDQKIQGNFSTYASIAVAYLTVLKSGRKIDLYGTDGQYRIEDLLYLARKGDEEVGRPFVCILDELDAIFDEAIHGEESVPWPVWSWRTDRRFSWAGIAAHRNEHRPLAWNDTFLSLCLQKGMINYVCAKLDNGAPMHQGIERKPLLHFLFDEKTLRYWTSPSLSFYSRRQYKPEPQKIVELSRLLLERGADPNEEFRGATLWENVLHHAIVTSNTEDFEKPGEFLYPNLARSWIWMDIINLFLDFGADPSAGILKHSYDGEKTLPLSLCLQEISTDRDKINKLHQRLRSLNGAQAPYTPPSRRPRTPLVWTLIPEPQPEDIPGSWEVQGDLRSWTQKVEGALLDYPDHEGLIPVQILQGSDLPPSSGREDITSSSGIQGGLKESPKLVNGVTRDYPDHEGLIPVESGEYSYVPPPPATAAPVPSHCPLPVSSQPMYQTGPQNAHGYPPQPAYVNAAVDPNLVPQPPGAQPPTQFPYTTAPSPGSPYQPHTVYSQQHAAYQSPHNLYPGYQYPAAASTPYYPAPYPQQLQQQPPPPPPPPPPAPLQYSPIPSPHPAYASQSFGSQHQTAQPQYPSPAPQYTPQYSSPTTQNTSQYPTQAPQNTSPIPPYTYPRPPPPPLPPRPSANTYKPPPASTQPAPNYGAHSPIPNYTPNQQTTYTPPSQSPPVYTNPPQTGYISTQPAPQQHYTYTPPHGQYANTTTNVPYFPPPPPPPSSTYANAQYSYRPG